MLTISWPKLSNVAVMGGSIGGTVFAIMSWLIVCRYYYGAINVSNLISNYSSLAGSTTSLYSGGLIAIVLTVIKPDNYDFKGTRSSKHLFEQTDTRNAAYRNQSLVKIIGQVLHEDDEMREDEITTEPPGKVSDEEKGMETPTTDIEPGEDFAAIEMQPKPADVKKAFFWSAVIIVVISVIIPIPLGASTYVFSTGFFTAYLVVTMVSVPITVSSSRPRQTANYIHTYTQIWSFFAAFCCILLPVWESRDALGQILRGLVALAHGQKVKPRVVN